MRNKRLRKSEINSVVKAMLPNIVRGKLEQKNNLLALNLKWKNFPTTICQSNVLFHYFRKGIMEQEEYDLTIKRIKENAEEGITSFGQKECDYLMEKFRLEDIYRNQFEDKNIMYKVKYSHERKIKHITLKKNLDFHYYDEIKVSLPNLYTLWILLVNENFSHKNFSEIMDITESLIMHIKQLYFTKDIIQNILQETKHFGNPDSFFVFYYHFTFFISLMKTIGDNLSWILKLYLQFKLKHINTELNSQKFKKALEKHKRYNTIVYLRDYTPQYCKIDEFRNVTQHRHIIRAMRVVLNSNLENKILIPNDPEVQISKSLKLFNRSSNKKHVKFAENKKSTILTGPHDYTIISPSDLNDYEDPVHFCDIHMNGVRELVEDSINRIVSEVTRKKVGIVKNYYSKIGVAELELTEELKVGSHILIEGMTTSFAQNVTEIQIDGKNVEKSSKGRVGIKIDKVARKNDIAYRIPKIDDLTYIPHLFK
jgi:hypothetical protein